MHIYRRGFDTILNAYDQLPPPLDSGYPTSGRGTWAATAINSTGTVPMVTFFYFIFFAILSCMFSPLHKHELRVKGDLF